MDRPIEPYLVRRASAACTHRTGAGPPTSDPHLREGVTGCRIVELRASRTRAGT